MRSINARFQRTERRNPYFSSYICFAQAVRGQKYTRDSVVRAFNRLVETDDYARTDKMALIEQLALIANTPEDNEKRG